MRRQSSILFSQYLCAHTSQGQPASLNIIAGEDVPHMGP